MRTSQEMEQEANKLYGLYIDQGLALHPMIQLLQSRQHSTGGFLEIGAGSGGSFDCWAQCFHQQAPKVSIDYYNVHSNDPVEKNWGRRNLRQHREKLWKTRFGNVHAIFAPSAEESTQTLVRKVLEYNLLVDFLFIDGRWQDVQSNFFLYSPFVRQGGIIALNCIHQERLDAEPVVRLWDYLVSSGTPSLEFPYGPHKSGLGVGGIGVLFV